jgi:hypothetical protein
MEKTEGEGLTAFLSVFFRSRWSLQIELKFEPHPRVIHPCGWIKTEGVGLTAFLSVFFRSRWSLQIELKFEPHPRVIHPTDG